MVRNSDYSYVTQHNLNIYAEEMEVQRPKSFGIDLRGDIETLKKTIEPLKDIEGVVIYDESQGWRSNQILKKIKTLRYLELHRVFTGVKTVDHLFDIFVEYGQPTRNEFEKKLADNFDWELVTALKPLMDELYQKTLIIANKVFWVIMYLQNPDFVDQNRKGKAQKILEVFPEYAWVGFSILDGKDLDPHKLWKTFTNSCS
jgi:hypothetical protein